MLTFFFLYNELYNEINFVVVGENKNSLKVNTFLGIYNLNL